MKPSSVLLMLAVSVGFSCGLSSVTVADPKVLGGITPDRRPEGLPVVGATGFTPAGMANALHGVASPPPASIGQWFDDQGGWFTPFTHPGMTGPYDIRNWHGKPNG